MGSEKYWLNNYLKQKTQFLASGLGKMEWSTLDGYFSTNNKV